MPHYLIIVESPAKVKTIKKFLGSNYDVEASGGHVRDLPKSQMGVDLKNDYEPRYITIRGKGDLLANLRKKVKKADRVYLATDPDREGEAIAWHLQEALKLDEQKGKRISFNEITKTAVKASLKEPRELDLNLVDAQQARRILDRVVGYSISPLLWKKVKRGLSAGRVQSACLAMVCEREDEINAFVPEEYWSLDASVQVDKAKKPLLIHYQDKNRTLTCEEDVNQLMKQLEHETFAVKEIKKSERTRKAPLPFTTSTLQQEAARQLNFSPQKTMRIAQQLYEGVDIKGSGTVGIITYLRTDSTRIAEEADQAAREYIGATYGEEYLSVNPTAKQKGKIQDAHEAIRPTDITRTPSAVKESLSRDQLRLYQLVWKRFAASRMADAKNETTTAKIMAGNACFTASTSRQLFDGFLMLYDNNEEKPEKNAAVDKLTEESVITLQEFHPDQHFTQPPAHFTEASLVKTMEECGIGRPSTYAPTIAILLGRHYVIKEEKNLYVTELGEAVNDIMKHSFPQIVDESFTARMEARLDQVAEGQEEWKNLLRGFVPDLLTDVEKAEQELEKVQIADEETDVICENCGRNMVIKYGPHGKFLACPGFPECKNTKPYLEKAGALCPKCGGEIVVRRTKKGRRFYACEKNPECDYMTWQKPASDK
ncbi:type I DNA topoisomerase [Hominifimenecus microfluidus]|uniref:type I DNA topoisomerase n=1 Tax=Hominifimenecus microfluidus TaxID=2885348 RepID=UPI0032C11FF2